MTHENHLHVICKPEQLEAAARKCFNTEQIEHLVFPFGAYFSKFERGELTYDQIYVRFLRLISKIGSTP